MKQDVEGIIANLRTETKRAIRSKNPNQTRDGRLAWYWLYIGVLDMAYWMGAITADRRQELCIEIEALQKAAMRPDEQKER